jgi:peptidoglycan pentaglycine glycine transferase (the first glycine)
MKLVEITDANVWEGFQAANTRAQFLQSWSWGEFRRSRGLQVRRFALLDDNGSFLVATALELRPKRFVGGYWYAPRGPIFSSSLSPEEVRGVFAVFLERLLSAGLSHSLFWRFEPLVELGKPEGLIPTTLRRNDPLNPASTIILDLEPSQDDLRSALHQKTRYNIGVAARKGVTTRLASTPEDVETFLKLMTETAGRDQFVQHDDAYLRATYAALSQEGMARIRFAEHEGKVLAANFEVLYGDTLTYLYGASSSASRELMAPYALHWDAITQAKRDGFALYDFWGSNPWSKAMVNYKKSWEGITRFKRGWGAEEVNFYGTWDLPFRGIVYRLAFLRHLLRG